MTPLCMTCMNQASQLQGYLVWHCASSFEVRVKKSGALVKYVGSACAVCKHVNKHDIVL